MKSDANSIALEHGLGALRSLLDTAKTVPLNGKDHAAGNAENPESKSPAEHPNRPLQLAEETSRLAALETGQYELERKEVAKRLGVRTSKLDELVASKRGGCADDYKQGRPVTLPEPEPAS
jgi:hypothetical protein